MRIQKQFPSPDPEGVRTIIAVYGRTRSLRKTAKETGYERRLIARVVRDGDFWDHRRSTAPKDEERIVKIYEETQSILKTADLSGFDREAVRRVLHEKVPDKIRDRGADIKYPVWNEAFDAPLSEEAAYWIGFIAADGCVITNRKDCRQPMIQIGLAEEDVDHVRKFLSFVSPGRPVSTTTRAGKGSAQRLCIGTVPSAKLVEECERYGIKHGKTYKMILSLPKENTAAFWRGMVDGDGGIYINPNRREVSLHFLALPNVIVQFHSWVRETTGLETGSVVIPVLAPQMRQIRFSGIDSPLTVLHALYDNASIYLDRKYALYQRALEMYG